MLKFFFCIRKAKNNQVKELRKAKAVLEEAASNEPAGSQTDHITELEAAKTKAVTALAATERKLAAATEAIVEQEDEIARQMKNAQAHEQDAEQVKELLKKERHARVNAVEVVKTQLANWVQTMVGSTSDGTTSGGAENIGTLSATSCSKVNSLEDRLKRLARQVELVRASLNGNTRQDAAGDEKGGIPKYDSDIRQRERARLEELEQEASSRQKRIKTLEIQVHTLEVRGCGCDQFDM